MLPSIPGQDQCLSFPLHKDGSEPDALVKVGMHHSPPNFLGAILHILIHTAVQGTLKSLECDQQASTRHSERSTGMHWQPELAKSILGRLVCNDALITLDFRCIRTRGPAV
jgi:hypothetical protein